MPCPNPAFLNWASPYSHPLGSTVRAAASRSWAAGPSMVHQPGAAVRGDQWTSRPVPGRAAEDTTSTPTDSHLTVAAPCAGTERPVGVLPGSMAG